MTVYDATHWLQKVWDDAGGSPIGKPGSNNHLPAYGSANLTIRVQTPVTLRGGWKIPEGAEVCIFGDPSKHGNLTAATVFMGDGKQLSVYRTGRVRDTSVPAPAPVQCRSAS